MGLIYWVRSRKLRTKVIFVLAASFFIWFWFCLPSKLFDDPTSYVLEDRNGGLMSATVSGDGQWRFPEMKEVPEKFEKCILVFEDKRFYSHVGVDPIAIGRAIGQNIQGKKVVSGGSTISMQVIRLAGKKKGRNLFRKFYEMILSMRLEIRHSKKEILAMYASHAPFGSNVVGLDAAAWRYYGRDPDQLSWGEMAALAVLPNSPSLVHPGRNREVLLRKRNAVLLRLMQNNTIDQVTYNLAIAEPLPGEPLPLPQNAPHLLNKFRMQNSGKSTRLQTTLDGELQQHVMEIVERHAISLRDNGVNNICALVMEVESGDVLAYVGNSWRPWDPEIESYVDVIASSRSPGSLLKPILYAAMLSDGLLLPNALVPDIPTMIAGYVPQNFNQTFDGAVTASQSISRSLNIPAVRMLQQYKYPRFYELLKLGGISTLNNPADFYGLSLILGGCEVTMWEVAGLYASLARAYKHQGMYDGKITKGDMHPPNYIRSRHFNADTAQHLIPLDMASLWFMFMAMEEIMRPGEEGLWQQFSSARRIAWKTGTSFGFRDAWSLGITPDHVVAVWTGNADGEGRAGLIGVRTASPAMFDIFRLLPSGSWFSEPEHEYTYLPVCSQSGFKAGPNCTTQRDRMVPANGERSQTCPFHQIIHVDQTGQFRVDESCCNPADMKHVSWFVLPPAMESYYKLHHAEYRSLPPFRTDCEGQEASRMMDLYYPHQGAKLFVPIEITGAKGSIVCQATHKKKSARILWHLDNTYLGQTQYVHQMGIQPSPGSHKLTLVDDNGETLERQFIITE